MAMTRVTARNKMLIYRPFSRELFAQGEREGPELLLQQLRGVGVDWACIEAKYTPRKRCSECNFVHFKDQFQSMQWNRRDDLSVCKECLKEKKSSGTPFRCNNCGLWKSDASFLSSQHHGMSLLTRVCKDCKERRRCPECHENKYEHEYSAFEWQKAAWAKKDAKCKDCMSRNRELKQCAGQCGRKLAIKAYTKRMWEADEEERKCLSCMSKCPRGHWRCIGCKGVKVVKEFSEWLAPRAQKVNNGNARCNACKEHSKMTEIASLKESVRHVVRHA